MNLLLQERIERGSVPEPNTGCWLWTGSIGAPGYGKIGVGQKKMSAHRTSYIAFVGEIPDGKIILHQCDTKSCVNPEHLSVGTHADNAADAVSKYPSRYRNLSKTDIRVRIEERSVPEPNSGCWLWTGSIVMFGYGEMLVGGRKTLAHRASYEVHFGPIPDGVLVLHSCNTRSCVNPQHLELGNHHDKRRARTSRTFQSRKVDPIDLKGRLDRLSVPEPNTGCHLWTGNVVKSTGYGAIKIDGKKMSAHCAAWIAHRGEIPVGMVVMHECDVRSCINPDHLSIGTRKDNSVDMARKRRGSFDKLTREQRVERSKRARQTLGPDGLKARAAARKASMTPEQQSESIRKYMASMTPEQRSETIKKRWSSKTPEQRKQHGDAIRNAWASKTPEQRSEIARKRAASMTPEQRREQSAAGRKAIALMRARQPSLLFNLLAPRAA